MTLELLFLRQAWGYAGATVGLFRFIVYFTFTIPNIPVEGRTWEVRDLTLTSEHLASVLWRNNIL